MTVNRFYFFNVTLSFLLLTSSLYSDKVNFNRDIRPILSDRCFHCHGPDEKERKGKLRLDTADGKEGAYRTHKGNTSIVPGNLEKSDLWYRITTDDEDDFMPPKKSHKKALNKEEIELVKKWILEGAEYESFWAFIPVAKPKLKNNSKETWGKGPIDEIVLKSLKKKKLTASKEADKRTLIRRLSFDITGLPPSIQEIKQFLDDKSPGAYENLVDRLIAKPQYGEHMTKYWADLVRLGDTNGMHKDYPRDFSTYRDWLIRSFNDNMPFDKFISYQLAGDLYKKPSQDQLIASGFNRLHLIIDRGTALPEESLHKNVLDRLTAFGTTFLGLTVQCAQCHDHKYDPISQKEFYQLYAFFNNFSGAPETRGYLRRRLQPPFIEMATDEQTAKIKEFDQALNQLKNLVKQKQNELQDIQKGEQANKEEKQKLVKQKQDEIKKHQGQIKKQEKDKSNYINNNVRGAMVMKEKDPPRPTFYLNAGAYDAPGDRVERATPKFLPVLKKSNSLASRMDLANWLVQKDHPLTARVAVNRFWQQLYGVGLVKTSEDFGAQGEWPSHPELLDYLAWRYMKSGWDTKALMKEVVMSQTYRQSSDASIDTYKKDPENRSLARGSRYRYDAEIIRDQILFLSGKINLSLYGKSVKPPQPPGLWKMVSMAYPRVFVADKGDKIYRRSLYTYWRRGMPPPQMTIMNAPSREYCTARRERTNTPLQALLLMNEGEFFKAAKSCASETLEDTKGDVDKTIQLLYEKVSSHPPSAQLTNTFKEAYQQFKKSYRENPKLAQSLSPETKDSEKQINLAAWTMLTHSLFNLEICKVRR